MENERWKDTMGLDAQWRHPHPDSRLTQKSTAAMFSARSCQPVLMREGMDAPTDRASAPPPALCVVLSVVKSPVFLDLVPRNNNKSKSHYLQFSLPDLAQKTFSGLFLFFSIHLDPTRRNWAFLRDLLDSFPLLVIYIIRNPPLASISPPGTRHSHSWSPLDALYQRAQIPTTAARYPAHARPFGIGVFLIDLIDYLLGRPGPARKRKEGKEV